MKYEFSPKALYFFSHWFIRDPSHIGAKGHEQTSKELTKPLGALKHTYDNRKLHFEFNPRTILSPSKKPLKQISDIWLKFGNWVGLRTFQHPL